MFRFILIFIFFNLLALPVFSQNLPNGLDANSDIPLRDYQFIINPPEGFKLLRRQRAGPDLIFEDFLPENETEFDYSQAFSFKSRPPQLGVGVADWALVTLQSSVKNCEFVKTLKNEPDRETGTFDLGYICWNRKPMRTSEGVVKSSEVQVHFYRFLKNGDTTHYVHRMWHGSNDEFDKLQPNFEALTSEWESDLSRYSLCHLTSRQQENCKGLDFDDPGGDLQGQPWAVMEIQPKKWEGKEPIDAIMYIFLDENEFTSVGQLLATANALKFQYENNMISKWVLLYKDSKKKNLERDRRKVGSYFFLLRDSLVVANYVPNENISIKFYNFLVD